MNIYICVCTCMHLEKTIKMELQIGHFVAQRQMGLGILSFSYFSPTALSGGVGVCMSSSDCGATSGGASDGNCAVGFGVCCVISIDECTADGAVRANGSFITSPGYPDGKKCI